MDRRPLAEDRVEIGVGECPCVERAEAFADDERSHERLLHGHLLVENEADQERHRVRGDECVGFVGVSEVQAVGHGAIIKPDGRAPGSARFTALPDG